MKKHTILFSYIFCCFSFLCSCQAGYKEADGQIWGTSYHIVYRSSDDLSHGIKKIMEQVNDELSMFNPRSTISLINSGENMHATSRVAEVMDLSKRVNKASGGVYDPTVGPLVDLWGFGRNEVQEIPSDSAIKVALQSVGIADCKILTDGTVCKKNSRTVFDFSSIAKGYGIDLIGRFLSSKGVKDYMIEIGGEILVKGHNPQGSPWRIQIDAPSSSTQHNALGILEMGPESTAMASSGNYRRNRKDDKGKVYGHTISPLTGYPISGEILAASIIGDNCAVCDAAATAAMALGDTKKAAEMIRQLQLRGVLVSADTTIFVGPISLQ